MTRVCPPWFVVLAATAACLCAVPSEAQLNGFNIKGDQGLKAGSQAPPGIYIGASLDWYGADTIRDREGRAISQAGEIGLFLGGPLLNVVTTKRLLGANVGFMAALPFANARIELPRTDENPAPGVSDLYVQPLNLGWHKPQVDVMTGYGLLFPTGRYAAGADDNTGLGMWGHELFAGTTVFLDPQRRWHVASTGAFEFHSKKQDSEAQVGPMLTLEGGVGRDFLKGAASAGVAYYAQWKLGGDTLVGLPSVLVRGKNRVAGLGPELTLPIATKSAVYGFVTLRYQWELGARTTTEGNAFNLLLVIPTTPIKVQP